MISEIINKANEYAAELRFKSLIVQKGCKRVNDMGITLNLRDTVTTMNDLDLINRLVKKAVNVCDVSAINDKFSYKFKVEFEDRIFDLIKYGIEINSRNYYAALIKPILDKVDISELTVNNLQNLLSEFDCKYIVAAASHSKVMQANIHISWRDEILVVDLREDMELSLSQNVGVVEVVLDPRIASLKAKIAVCNDKKAEYAQILRTHWEDGENLDISRWNTKFTNYKKVKATAVIAKRKLEHPDDSDDLESGYSVQRPCIDFSDLGVEPLFAEQALPGFFGEERGSATVFVPAEAVRYIGDDAALEWFYQDTL